MRRSLDVRQCSPSGKSTMCVLALADDMTGALEVGAKFSGAGIDTIVSAKPIPAGSAPVVVLDTETRHADPETAAREVTRFVMAACGAAAPRLIYKKTDSTLRGNIRTELQALAQMFPQCKVGYAPAYPAMGRSVRAGVLYVHGRPVAETEFARDELNPVADSSIAALLDPLMERTVFDGEFDIHLADAARTILSDPAMRIAAGPAGLAEMIAATITLPRSERRPFPRVRTCLILNGSRHEKSARQVSRFAAMGWRLLHPCCEPGWSAAEVASRNAKCLAEEIARDKPDAVFVIGGDTAFAAVRELGLPPIFPIAEAVPGVPVSRISANDVILITKAGGFGDDDMLSRVHAILSGDGRIDAE